MGGKPRRPASGNDHDIVYHQVQFPSDDDTMHIPAMRKSSPSPFAKEAYLYHSTGGGWINGTYWGVGGWEAVQVGGWE